MVRDNDQNMMGFAGLVDMASEVRAIEETINMEVKSFAPNQHSEPQHETASSNSTVNTTKTTPAEPENANSRGNSGWKWFFGCIGIYFFLWLIVHTGQRNKESINTKPLSAQESGSSLSESAPVDQHRGEKKSDISEYKTPSVGENKVLSVSEIRWCIREAIRIESMRGVIETDRGIKEFNKIVDNYNSRCGNYQYSEGSRMQAVRDVDLYRSQIVAKAIADALRLDRPQSSSSSSQEILEAQRLLVVLGYDPGPIDGDYGRRTSEAVKAFQRDVGTNQDGKVDHNLLFLLRKSSTVNITN